MDSSSCSESSDSESSDSDSDDYKAGQSKDHRLSQSIIFSSLKEALKRQKQKQSPTGEVSDSSSSSDSSDSDSDDDKGSTEAFVTLATNDTYSLGCLVLGASLKLVETTKKLAVMITTGVSNPMRIRLAQVFDYVEEVDFLDSRDPENLGLLGRPDLNVTFTKLHCWRLTQFTKAVFLDADVMVIDNVDDLFDREELSAAPDVGWPDCFNSGVFVFTPSLDTYQSLIRFAEYGRSFDDAFNQYEEHYRYACRQGRIDGKHYGSACHRR